MRPKDAAVAVVSGVPNGALGGEREVTRKRGYTYEFTPKSEKHGRYLLDKIPADLWRRVRQKCIREETSVRATILRLLTEWLDK